MKLERQPIEAQKQAFVQKAIFSAHRCSEPEDGEPAELVLYGAVLPEELACVCQDAEEELDVRGTGGPAFSHGATEGREVDI